MKTRSKKDLLGIKLFGGGLLVLAAIGWAAYTFSDKESYDATTLCPMTGALKQTVVVIDKSDKWDRDDTSRVSNLINDLNLNVKSKERITIVSIAGATDDNNSSGRPTTQVMTGFDMCNPGSVEECNAFYENCRDYRNNYNNNFKANLDSVVEHLIQPGEASFSPLLETVVQVIDDSTSSNVDIHIVSDFMENGAKFRFYNLVPLYEDLVKEYPVNFATNISVTGHSVERRRHSRELINAVESVWLEYFQNQGIDAKFSRFLITN